MFIKIVMLVIGFLIGGIVYVVGRGHGYDASLAHTKRYVRRMEDKEYEALREESRIEERMMFHQGYTACLTDLENYLKERGA